MTNPRSTWGRLPRTRVRRPPRPRRRRGRLHGRDRRGVPHRLPRPRPPRHHEPPADHDRGQPRAASHIPRPVPAAEGRTQRMAPASSAAHFYGPYFAYEARGATPGPACGRRSPPSTSSTSRSPIASSPRRSPRSCRAPRGSSAPAAQGCPLQRRPLPRHVRADGGGGRLGRAAHRPPVLRMSTGPACGRPRPTRCAAA